MRPNKSIKKILKFVLYTFLVLLLLLVILIIYINTDAGKRMVKNKATDYLSNKLHTRVSIGSVDYRLPKWIVLNNVYLEDRHKDTLLYAEKLAIDISMLKLLRGNTDIQKLALSNSVINIRRAAADSFFNYQFVIDAFSSPATTNTIQDSSALKLNISNILLDRVSMHFDDKNAGSEFSASINKLETQLHRFQADRLQFGVNNFVASGINLFMNIYKEPATGLNAVADSASAIASYALNINAALFDVRDVKLDIRNSITGLNYHNQLTHLALKNIYFNQGSSTANAGTVQLDSSIVQFIMPKMIAANPARENQTAATGNSWKINATALSMRNNHIQFDDNNLPRSGGLDPNHFNVMNLAASVSAFSYSAAQTAAMVKQISFTDTSGFVLDTLHINFLMNDTAITAKELYIKTPRSILQKLFSLQYDSLGAITSNPRNTALSAILNNSSIAFNDLYLLLPSLKTSFPPSQFANNKVNFNTELRGNLAQLYLPYMQLAGFSGTRLNAHGTLYNLTDASLFSYDLYIENSHVLKADLLKFVAPENQLSFAKLPDVFSLTGHLKGNKENLVADVQTNGQGISLNGLFSLQHMTDPARIKYDFNLRNSSIDKSIIMGFIPPGKLPAGFNLPDKINISGLISGNTNNLKADFNLNDSYGNAAVKGFINNMTDPRTASYDLAITTNNYDIGKLLGQDTVLGKVTGSFTAKGTGFDYKTMRSAITASIKELEYNHYQYQQATITAVFNNGLISSKGKINDSSLRLNYNINADVKSEYPSVTGYLRVDTARLHQLNFYKDTLNFSLAANIQANSLRPRNLDINTLIDSVNLQSGSKFYTLDSISLMASSTAGKDDISFRSPVADLHLNGAFDYDKVGYAIAQYVNHYYKLPVNVPAGRIDDQQMVFEGLVKKSPLLTGIIPGLVAYEDINFKGSFASADADSALNFSASVPFLHYQDKKLSNGSISLSSKNENILYAVKADTLKNASNIFYGTRLYGTAARDSLFISALTQDNRKKDWFGIKASLFQKDKTFSFRLQDSLLLNYERWNVAADNYTSYSPAGLVVHNFSISSDTAKILINSRQETGNSPVDIIIDNFNLKSISSIINRDTLFASGKLDAKMELSDLQKNIPSFTGNFTISDLAIKQQPLGTLTANASKQSDNNISTSVTLVGVGNEITANGNYYLNNTEREFDLTAGIKKLNIASLQGFTGGSIKNATGNITGNFTADGKFADPRWKGLLSFDTTKFTLAQTGTSFKITGQQISFDYPVINFKDFIVRDTLNHQAKIDGSITFNKDATTGLDLHVKADNFIFVNASRNANSEFYGYAVADADVYLTGNQVSPDIEGDIYIKDKSDLVIVIPERSYGKDEGKTIVRFIDRDTFQINPPVKPFTQEKESNSAFAQYLNYNLNIEIQKQAALTIIIDPVTGDEIKVQGDARLNAGVDPGGNLVIAGNYDLDNGYYLFNYQFLQRKFVLQKGSSIVFGGEPMKARLNVTAAYTVNTSSGDLLRNQVGNSDPILANSLNQKIPFKLLLYLTGPVSKPIIKFDIQLPDDNTIINSDLRGTIENKLTQIRGDESATNKQVFSLLLLGRFTGEQSSDFFISNGNDFNDIARQSVSQFLSSALNEIAGNLLKGVDIDLNLNSYRDFSNGGNQQRTDLNVALSKTFLDNKLTVTVGKNFGVQGQDAEAKAGAGFIPDVTVAYKLTADGKYMLRAYRKNQFKVLVDGYVVETGLGFIVTIDYEKFHDLFRGKK